MVSLPPERKHISSFTQKVKLCTIFRGRTDRRLRGILSIYRDESVYKNIFVRHDVPLGLLSDSINGFLVFNVNLPLFVLKGSIKYYF